MGSGFRKIDNFLVGGGVDIREREREGEMFVKFCLNMKKISGSTY